MLNPERSNVRSCSRASTTSSSGSDLAGTPDAPKLDLTKRLADLDEERLTGLPDAELVATMNQRRYFADLKQQDEWKRQKNKNRKKLRFRRPKQF
jgi:hypothetical protein